MFTVYLKKYKNKNTTREGLSCGLATLEKSFEVKRCNIFAFLTLQLSVVNVHEKIV